MNPTELKIGDLAPEFCLSYCENAKVELSDFQGRKVVLYFYPKDDTPGCTQEACDFRDNFDFLSTKSVILGISKDDPKNHEKFKQKYTLPFMLLSDENGDVCETYGVLNKKSLFGKTCLGIERSTFLIDEYGKILAIWRKVKVKEHIQQVINELKKYD